MYTRTSFPVILQLLWKRVHKKNIFEKHLLVYPVHLAYGSMQFIIDTEKSVYLHQKVLFCSIIWHHLIFKKWSLLFLHKRKCHMILEMFSTQECCKIWSLRDWNWLAEWVVTIPDVSIECFWLFAPKQWYFVLSFPSLKTALFALSHLNNDALL